MITQIHSYGKFVLWDCLVSLLLLASCSNDEPPYTQYLPPHRTSETSSDSTESSHPKQIEFEGVKTDGLKILAIGNSYTWNGTLYLPWLLQNADADDAFIAILTESGASLAMHWTNHWKNESAYEMHYSHGGKWNKVSITTIDEALQVFDWDIVVMQQMSTDAGKESTYRPYLDNLLRLISDTNTQAKIAWQYTWTFTSDAAPWHVGFKYYDNDPNIMYDALIVTQDKIALDFDFRIPSCRLVKMLRDSNPEQKDGFSSDGVHLTDPASYALSCLWHEVLVSPLLHTTCLDMEKIPSDINKDFSTQSHALIKNLLNEFDSSGVPYIRI